MAKQATEWGKSMYGGYYINYFDNGRYTGEHFEKLKDLKSWCIDNNITFKDVPRIDNI